MMVQELIGKNLMNVMNLMNLVKLDELGESAACVLGACGED